MERTMLDTATDDVAPELRADGPGDLDAVVDLLTKVFLDDPLMSAIAAAAPEPRAALGHLHRVELAAHYLAADPAARADSRVDLAVDAADLSQALISSLRLSERWHLEPVHLLLPN